MMQGLWLYIVILDLFVAKVKKKSEKYAPAKGVKKK